MAIKNKLIPFRLFPAAWGLSGKSYQKAKAEYELDGYDLDIAISHIEHLENPLELQKDILRVDLKYGKIDKETFDRQVAKLAYTDKDVKELELVDIEIDFKYKKISEKEYNKRKATLANEPWVDVLGVEIDPKNLIAGGAFSLDWNDAFIDELRSKGYQGANPDMIVKRWFDSLCVDIAIDSGLLLEGEGPELTTKATDFPDGRKEYS